MRLNCHFSSFNVEGMKRKQANDKRLIRKVLKFELYFIIRRDCGHYQIFLYISMAAFITQNFKIFTPLRKFIASIVFATDE